MDLDRSRPVYIRRFDSGFARYGLLDFDTSWVQVWVALDQTCPICQFFFSFLASLALCQKQYHQPEDPGMDNEVPTPLNRECVGPKVLYWI